MFNKTVITNDDLVYLREKAVIPKMSSSTHESGVQVIGGGVLDAWRGFTHGESYYRSSINGSPNYITIRFPKSIRINSVFLVNNNDYIVTRAHVLYKNEKGDFVEWINEGGLDFHDQVLYTSAEYIQTTELRIMGHRKGSNSWGFREYNFFLKIENKILIKKDNQYGYYTDSFQSLGTTYPTKEQFEQYGMSDLSMLEPGDIPIEYEMELINQTEEEKFFSYTFDLNGQHKNIKSIDGIITE